MKNRKKISREIHRISEIDLDKTQLDEGIRLLGQMKALIWVLED